MTPTSALYFPTIDIQDINWLKNAVLYWDEIATIVPESLKDPYNARETQILHNEGILKPFLVDPFSREVRKVSSDFGIFLRSSKGKQVLNLAKSPNGNRSGDRYDRLSEIHPDKLGHELTHQLLGWRVAARDGAWLQANSLLISHYMTFLAGHIANFHGLSLLSEDDRFTDLAGEVRRGIKDDRYRPSPNEIRQALLGHFMFEIAKVAPTTSIDKILEFKKSHKDELGHFRLKMHELVLQLNEPYPSYEAFEQKLRDLYRNEVIPSLNDINLAMSRSRIQHTVEFVKASFFCAPGFILSDQLFAPAIGNAAGLGGAIVGGAVYFLAQKVLYDLNKEEMLRNNPYSYVYYAQKHF